MPRLLLLLLFLLPGLIRGAHFSGSRITYECIGGSMYRIHLDLYLDCAGEEMIPQTLNFNSSCGINFSLTNLMPVIISENSPVCEAELSATTCNGGTLPGFQYFRFTTQANLSPCTLWTIHWSICCRNTMVNVPNQPGLYVNATVNTLGTFCDRSPVFTNEGVPFGCVNVPFQYNPGVYDPDGHALSFAFISARYGSPTPFPVNYSSGYSGTQPIPGITLDPSTGQIAFTATVAGYYAVVIQVTSLKPDGSLIGRVLYDMMFVIRACNVTPPEFDGLTNGVNASILGPAEFIYCSGSEFCVDMVFSDNSPLADIEVFTNASTLMPGSTFQITGTDPVTGTLCWDSPPLQSTNSFDLFVEIDNGVCPIPATSSTYIIVNVCDPLPVELLSFEADLVMNGVLVNWVTGSEWNADRFVLERSADGVEFATIAELPAIGSQHQTTTYAHLDNVPIGITIYYRLLQIDLDGTTETSDVVAVSRPVMELDLRPDGNGGFLVSGVPVSSNWSVIDAAGRTCSTGMSSSDGTIWLGPDLIQGVRILFIQTVDGRRAVKLPMFVDGTAR